MGQNELLDERTSGMVGATLSRRNFIGRALALGFALPAVSLLAACGSDDDDEPEGSDSGDSTATTMTTTGGGATAATGDATAATGDATATTGTTQPAATATTGAGAGEGQRGGTLKVALIGEPPTLDIHQTTATIVSLVTWHMYEALFTWDSEFQIIPLLAEGIEVSEDGLTNTITLRQGVPFHNGEEMKAADVVASIERWGQISGLGKNLVEAIAETTIVDDYTIDYTMNAPFGTFAVVLARQNQGCAIYPKSLIDTAGIEQIEDGFIGTGPYKFNERQADRYIRVERFDDYAALEGEPNGYGGTKHQYVDMIEFIPAPDEAARIAGLQAGDYHYLESISTDQYEALKDDDSVVAELLPPSGWDIFVLNTKLGIMQDLRIRQAVQAALDHEPILIAGQGQGFYRLDPSIMLQETAFHSTVGEELYNRNDPEAVTQLLTEAGYDGTPIRFMCTQEYLDQYNEAVVGAQQLEAAGFTIDLQVYDWATLIDRRGDETLWDIFTTGIAFRVDPVTLPFLQGNTWPGWWATDAKVEAVTRLQSEAEFDARYAAFEDVQRLYFDEVPAIKLGDVLGVSAVSPKLKGPAPLTQLSAEFVNVWLED